MTSDFCWTRDASAHFREEVRKVLTKAGLKIGKYNPSTHYHEKVDIKAMVHGDDFTSSWSRKSLRRFKQVLECRFGISTVVVGDGREEVHETKVVNRIIRMDREGWHCEADQRHGELIVKALNLHEAKSVSTPGRNEKSWQEEEDRERLNNQDASQYRALAASAYLALDRTDVQYAFKEMCRGDEQPHPR